MARFYMQVKGLQASWWGYALAVLAVCLATAIRWELKPWLGPEFAIYPAYFLACAIIIRFTWVGPSIFAIVLSSLAQDYFFLPPIFSIGLPPSHLAATTIFIAANLFILALAQTMRRAKELAEANALVARQAEASLRESEQRFRLALRNAPVSVFTQDRELRYNWAFSSRLSAEQVLGKRDDELFSPGEAGRLTTLKQKVLEQNAEAREQLWLNPSMGAMYVDVSCEPIRDEAGRAVGVRTAAVELTDLKMAEEALQKAKAELATVNQGLEQKVHQRTAELNEMVHELEHFSYTLIHDMRAPLRTMHALSKMLLNTRGDRSHPETGEVLRRIAEAATRMDNLITDSLNYAKIASGRVELETVNPKPLLQEMLETYPEFHLHKAHIEIAERFPMVLGNRARLTQCFSNLLSNALKFVPPGVVPAVRVWAEPNGESVRLYFQDNGIGIPPEYQDQIWGMFQKLSKDYDGTGIGLALVRKAVQRMGGRVGLQSEPGKGSCFWLELKAAPSTQG